jgi:hypothetical protein
MAAALMSCFAVNLFECAACAACSFFTAALNWTMAQASRFSHVAIIVITFSIAIIIGKSYPDKVTEYSQYTSLDLTQGCNADYIQECIYRQLIYRASLALVVVFTFLAALSYVSDYINKGFWVMKVAIAVGLFVAFWWGGNPSFSQYAEAIRVLSFIWLIFQAILLLDFAHDVQEVIKLLYQTLLCSFLDIYINFNYHRSISWPRPIKRAMVPKKWTVAVGISSTSLSASVV